MSLLYIRARRRRWLRGHYVLRFKDVDVKARTEGADTGNGALNDIYIL